MPALREAPGVRRGLPVPDLPSDGRPIVRADQCGGCRGEGSHRRHCPRHPSYHPWIPLADQAESIGDSIGVPELANRAWALGAAIRAEMPNHPYRRRVPAQEDPS